MSNLGFESTKKSAYYSRISSGVLILGLAVLAWSIVTQDRLHFDDEHAYLSNVELLEKHGFSRQFLEDYFGSAGPLYPSVHYLLKPITGLTSPGLQMVNLVFLGLIIYFLGLILTRGEGKESGFESLQLLAFPMIYVCTGLVLTEMPAMFFLVLSCWFLLKWREGERLRNPAVWLWLIAAGLSFCLAILGRQIYLILLPLLFVLVLPTWPARLKDWMANGIPFLVFTLASLFLPGVVFYVWGGLVAPFDAAFYAEIAERGIKYVPSFGIFALGYMGIVALLVAPRLFEILWNPQIRLWAIGTVLLIGLGNLFAGVFEYTALEGLALRFLPEEMVPLYGRAVGGGLLALAAAFVAAAAIHGWKLRSDRLFLVSVFACLAIALTSIKMTQQFSSRYVAQAAPFLLIILARFPTKSLWGPLGKAIGAGLGLVSLYSYLGR